MKHFSVHFNVHIQLQIVILNNFENCRPPFKMKPRTRRVPKIGKNTLENCNVQNFDDQVKGVVGAHMKEYRNKWKTAA